MHYIILAAGKGTRLQPLTNLKPKCLFNLGAGITVIQRMVGLIQAYDEKANVIIVSGYMREAVKQNVSNFKRVKVIDNPFYACTNSVASLWFAKDFITEETVIINGDLVFDERIYPDLITRPISRPTVLIDSSIKTNGDYVVHISGEHVIVMGKQLTDYYGEYAGVTKIDKNTVPLFKSQVEYFLDNEMYDQWYENVFMQLIFDHDFHLYYEDVADYGWREIDSVNDLLRAKEINTKKMKC